MLSVFVMVDNIFCELFTSTSDMENMLKVEGILITHLGGHLLKQEAKLNYFQKYDHFDI